MKILADENIARQVVEKLREDGHDIQYTIEGLGIADTVVLNTAYHTEAVILTDDKDFGDLVIQQGLETAGVILVRLPGLSHQEKAEIVAKVVRDYEDTLMYAMTVITPSKVRIRGLSG